MKRIMIVMVVLAGAVSVAGAQDSQSEGLYIGQGPLPDPVLEARAVRLASQLQCPVCQGQSINASPAPMAQQMKDIIRGQVADGYTNEQVKEYFVSKYGEWVLLEPRAAGFNLLVYILPGLALLAGVALVITMIRRWSVTGEAAVVTEDQ